MPIRCALCSLPLLLACSAPAPHAASPVRSFGGRTMGSTYEVEFTGSVPLDDVRREVEAELDAFDATFSKWREDSETSRCNRHASTAPFPASERFCAVLQSALDVAAATGGAFDPTVEPLVAVYRRCKQDPEHRLDETETRHRHCFEIEDGLGRQRSTGAEAEQESRTHSFLRRREWARVAAADGAGRADRNEAAPPTERQGTDSSADLR